MNRKLTRLGYARVSTLGQHTDNQVALLKEAGASEVFEETVSGSKNAHSVVFRNLFDRVKELREEGHEVEVIVTKLDRFSRSLMDLLKAVTELADLGASFRTLDNSLSYEPGNPSSKLMLQIFGAMAEFERSLIVARTSEGRVAAQERGVKFGPKPKLTREDVARIKADHASGRYSIQEVAKRNKTSRSTALRVLELYGTGPYMPLEDWQASLKKSAKR